MAGWLGDEGVEAHRVEGAKHHLAARFASLALTQSATTRIAEVFTEDGFIIVLLTRADGAVTLRRTAAAANPSDG